ncbi:XRE family transcriptional regulator, partial [Alistipes sp. OttesenSCG-928-L06]|nr:XRE family transcriptional regulator [Alistipes sp. OttesenSCG-928-L06]
MNERVKEVRRALGMTQDQLGEILGVKKSTLSMIETGKAALSNRNKQTLVQKLNVNPDWLDNGEGEMIQAATQYVPLHQGRTDYNIDMQRIPLYNIEGTAGLVPLFLNQQGMTPIDYIQIPNLPRCDGAIYVTGDSMYPLLKSGDIVLYKQIHDILNNIFWGEMYLISIDLDGEEYITVKYIQKSDVPDHVKLVSQNQHHADKDMHIGRIKALALVKACIRMN